jgi:hypothetical protein
MPKAKASKKSASPVGSRKRTDSLSPQISATGLPHMSPTYGLKARDKYLPFSHAETRLAKSHNYWICTARPDGRPHSIPVWGFWIDGALYFGTARDSRKSHNLSHNPAISIHLESGDDVVILEGTAAEVDPNDKPTFKKARRRLAREVQHADGCAGLAATRSFTASVRAWCWPGPRRTFPIMQPAGSSRLGAE